MLLIVFALITLKIKIEVLEFTSINLNTNKFKIKLKVYLFKFLKLFEIAFTEKGLKIFRKEKEYKYKFTDLFKKILEKENMHIIDIISFKNLRDFDFKVRSLDLKLKVGVLENMLTSFLVTILSTILSSVFLFENRLYSKNKFCYEIYPEFDKFCLNIDLNLKLDVSIKGIYKFVVNNYSNLKDLMKIVNELNKDDVLINDVAVKKLKESSI